MFLKYCDGSSWTSLNSTSTVVNNTRIFYNGRRQATRSSLQFAALTLSLLQHTRCNLPGPSQVTSLNVITKTSVLFLPRRGLDSATEVVVGGCSAGGLAVILNIDAVAELLPPTARIR